MDRLRARLHDDELAGDAVFRPLDVHRLRVPGERRIVLLDQTRPARERQHVVVGQTEPRALLGRGRLAARAFGAVGVDQPHFFRAEPAADDGAMARAPASA